MNQMAVRGQTIDDLYRKHHDAVFRACLRFAAGDRDWAMDRTHDVFVTLAREVDALRDVSDLGGWLYRVAVNTCLMDLRRAKGWRKVRDQVAHWIMPEPPQPDRVTQARRDASALEAAISNLPLKQRGVMTLIHLDGKSQVEAARILEVSEGQVSKLHKQALTTLQLADWEISGG